MKYPILMIAVLGALCYLSSCTSDQTPVPVLIDTSCTHDGQDNMSFQNDIVPILNTYCTQPSFGACHQSVADGGIGFDYTTHAGLAAELPEPFITRVLGPSADMPQATTTGPTELTTCEKEKLQLWIDQGFPDN